MGSAKLPVLPLKLPGIACRPMVDAVGESVLLPGVLMFSQVGRGEAGALPLHQTAEMPPCDGWYLALALPIAAAKPSVAACSASGTVDDAVVVLFTAASNACVLGAAVLALSRLLAGLLPTACTSWKRRPPALLPSHCSGDAAPAPLLLLHCSGDAATAPAPQRGGSGFGMRITWWLPLTSSDAVNWRTAAMILTCSVPNSSSFGAALRWLLTTLWCASSKPSQRSASSARLACNSATQRRQATT